jgi:hypothetical protein
VSFYLDDPTRSKTPKSVELSSPWDLMGGSTTAANPWDTATIAAGTHTMTVAVVTSAGTTVKSVTFAK